MIHLTEPVCRLLVLILLCASMLAACDGTTEAPPEATPPGGGDGDPLAATSWRLVSVGDQGVLPGTFGTAIFGEHNNLSGYGGCNDYSATYQIEGEQLSLTALVPSAVACKQPEAVAEQEKVFLAFMENAPRFQVDEDQLMLSSVDATKTLTFVAAPPAPLQGTNWTLPSANDLHGAVMNPISGTEITALFADDGKVTGSAGCNDYTASYGIGGESIRVGPIAVTEKHCSEPEGVMDQEAGFLQLLASAAAYENLADYMDPSNGDGERVLIYAASVGGE